MKIDSVTVCNFQSFGPEPVTLSLGDTTVLVGTNGAGKTALLQALLRMFGTARTDRNLRSTDFHVDPGVPDSTERSLYIEVRLAFPELADDAEDVNAANSTVPQFMNDMVIAGLGEIPFARLRLEGKWTKSSAPDGETEEHLYWVTTAAERIGDKDKKPVQGFERSHIQVHYLPAVRDPGRLRSDLFGTMLRRLVNAVIWSDAARSVISDARTEVAEQLQNEKGAAEIQKRMQRIWETLYDGHECTQLELGFLETELEDVVRRARIVFRGALADECRDLDILSEGPRSLLYFTLASVVLHLERDIAAKPELDGISADDMQSPALTVLAVEEPENHVSPHYLGRIMRLLGDISAMPSAQVLLTSHSPAIVSRVDPRDIVHFRLVAPDAITKARRVTLPKETDEACKYVRNGITAYPELYFARMVILVEGDSEQIVIPLLASAHGVHLDPGLVSVVPLGGRHVNHLWRLLTDLEIPFVTLLDLDYGRSGGGWGRIKYACNQLSAVGVDLTAIFAEAGEDDVTSSEAAQEKLALMHERGLDDTESLMLWLVALRRCGVFYSRPLDLDLIMLSAFPEAYKALAPGAQKADEAANEGKKTETVLRCTQRALGIVGDAPARYQQSETASLMPWYCRLFLDRSKPATHLEALSALDGDTLKEGTPEQLRALIERIGEQIGLEEGEDD